MSIEKLKNILSLPDAPLEVPRRNEWDALFLDFCPLPDDYVEFINHYGTGTISEFVWIFNPFAKNPYLNLRDEGKEIISSGLQMEHQMTGRF